MRIRIFSDFNCPFCWLGSRIIAKLREELDFQDEWLPLELHPEISEQGSELLDKYLQEELDGFVRTLNSRGEELGIHYAPMHKSRNSHKALLAGEFARDNGAFYAFHQRVYVAYFTEDRDISSDAVLKECASDCGLDPVRMIQAVQDGRYEVRLADVKKEAKARDIQVAPTFLLDDGQRIVGAQSLPLLREQFVAIRSGLTAL
ncbi:DsbA family protein [Desulfobaculum bizertense]|uniref:DsbA family oxidoreductase n=1 Tax=Desulfobaculum bizertense TaxID=376490 RepID=UPI001F198C86|nr:DsbA family protein [Desulfobaculum bizertense]UIJ37685.1 DsbA family protein [Desulfobaculum bizertense]